MFRQTCSLCNIEKHIADFYRKKTECKDCKTKKCLKRYYENKDKLSSQRKL